MTSFKTNQVLLLCFNKISFFLSEIAKEKEEKEKEKECDPEDTGCIPKDWGKNAYEGKEEEPCDPDDTSCIPKNIDNLYEDTSKY